MSVKQRIAQTQLKLIVKNELVATYGFKLVVSGLSSNTRQVQQLLSTFSTRNTDEVVPPVTGSLVVGIVSAVPLDPHVKI